MPEQHCEPVEHAESLAEQVPVPASVVPVPPSDGGGVVVDWQALVSSEVLRHSVPVQHTTPASPSQRVPTGEHVPPVEPPSGEVPPPPGAWHRRTPPASGLESGRHRVPLQHWSENWQMLFVWMQQVGLFLS